jgi:hypothetical protein
MAKSKGIILGADHLNPARKVTVQPGHGQGVHSVGGAAADARGHYSVPPANDARPVSETREERFHAGHGDTHAGHNVPEGKHGEPMGDLSRDAPQGKPVAIETKDPQMPDRKGISKAQEVADELHKHGEGEGFTGTMNR